MLRQAEAKGSQHISSTSLGFVGGGAVDFNVPSLFQRGRTLFFLI